MMRSSGWRGAMAVACVLIGGMTAARGDDLDQAGSVRDKVNAEIDVLSAAKVTPSDQCLSALQEMHTAESQVTQLGGDLSNAPSDSALSQNEQGEVSVARDVLASDMDNAFAACRADAVHACGGGAASALAKPCAGLARHHISG